MSKNDQLDNLDIAISDSLLGPQGGKPAITVSNPLCITTAQGLCTIKKPCY